MSEHKEASRFKQIFRILALVALAFSWSQASFASNDPDVTGDGRVNILDVSTVSSCLGRDLASVTRCECADTNGDRVIDKFDYGFVASKVGSSGYPIEPNACQVIKPNTPPTANAGLDQTVTLGQSVSLNASGSSDADGNALSFKWSFITTPAGSSATISNSSTVAPGFIADRPGNYNLQVTVSDGKANSTDTVTVSTINSPPVANAGADQSMTLGSATQLNGAASSDVDGNLLSFAWSLVTRPKGSAATLSTSTAFNPTFIADLPGTYVAQLIVNDGAVDSVPDTVTITTNNVAPVANAGADQNAALGSMVQLDGSTSSDPEGLPLSYSWSVITHPVGSSVLLSATNIANPVFVIDRVGTYIVQLIVHDGVLNSAADTVIVTTSNTVPVANAGPDQSVTVGATVTLDGRASADADGNALSFSWSFTSVPPGSAVPNLSNPISTQPSYSATHAGKYVAQLIVGDGVADSAPDTATVEAMPAVNNPPVARPDSYSMNEDGVLFGTSVLANDFDADNDSLSARTVANISSGALTFNVDGTFTYTPSANFNGNATFSYRADDGADDSGIAVVTIRVAPTNDIPIADAGADLTGNVGAVVVLDGSASSDPDGDTLTYQWSLIARPAGSAAALVNPTAINSSFTPDVAGAYNARLVVNDGKINSAQVGITITVAAQVQNTAPVALADNYQVNEGQVLLIAARGLLVNDSDAQGDPLTAELASTAAHGTVALQADGGFSYSPNLGFAGIDQFSYRARDAALYSTSVVVDIVVTADPNVLPLDVDLNVAPQGVPVGGLVSIAVTPRGGRAPVSRVLSVNGVSVVLDATGGASIAAVSEGIYRVVATVTDALGSVSKEGFFSGKVNADAAAPTVAITAPANGTELFGAVNVVGTVNDANLAEYRLLFGATGSTQFTEFSRGVIPVVNGILGRFDVTGLANGLYDILLQATDVNGTKSQAVVTVEVVGDQKVGNFEISFEDLNVDAAGIPITVTRTYSTARRAEPLDFGYGWSIDYQNVKVQTNKILGVDWALSSSGFIIKTWCLKPNGKHTVSVTLPDGKVERFDMTVSPECQQVLPPQNVTPVFAARAGTRSKLTTSSGVLYVNGSQLLDLGTVEPYDPTSFTLTTEGNYVYELDKNFGVRSARDPSGNTLTYSSSGIIHSGGQSVSFLRDGQGRITRITDPNGKAIDYAYNANGDLSTVVDRASASARHRYNRSHGLVDFTDPRGVLLMRNVYDNAGKLIEQYDATGNKVAITSDTANQREVVRDRRGFTTTHEYDVSGNVTRTIDALGGSTGYTYDTRGNELSTTDPLGRVTARIFSAEDRILSEKDPLGNITAYAYDVNGQPTQIVDAKGNKTEIVYSPAGAPTQIKDGTGVFTAMAYDAKGNLTQLTDPLGNVTRYTFNSAGRLTQEQDALGNATSYTYDSNGKETSRTTRRSHNGAPVNMTTQRVLDANGRVLKETDANGATEISAYNSLGKLASRVDKLGNTTFFEYDSRGSPTTTIYADGTRESIEYDANGNESVRTDRAGRKSTLAYDALNRLVKTILPDASELSQTYDAAGQLIEERDARGNKTAYQYDAAGRRTKLTDALGNATLTVYDAVGNVSSVTDARGNTITYQYDAANRRTRTTFPDGTFSLVAYDSAGRKVSETNQAGNATAFAYDGLSRLIAVTDPVGGITNYTYDEVGNKLTQKDALGHITRWEYDNLGRVTKRTLPEGQFETFNYDANSNALAHIDFKGATTQFTYDANNRLLRKRHPDGSEVKYAYTPSGQPATVTDNRGVTRNFYDVLNRVIKVENPDGSVLAYAYDAAGNRTQLTVQQGARPPRVTRFGYDTLNRPASVTDPEGGVTAYTYDANGNRASVTLPNGVRAAYTYDVQNRLTLLEHRRADNSQVARFAYTLSADGQRVRAVETVNGVGRTVDYTYDAYQRLVREQIADPANGNRNTTYIYDAVGNRLTMTANDAPTNYTYDANDRLLSESVGGIAIAYSYDANGNTLAKRQGVTTVAAYTWDAENRLTGAIDSGHIIAYAYDAAGNRVAKTLDGVTSHYLVDTNREYAEVVEERGANGDLVAGFVHGDDLIKQLRSGQGTYYHADGLGSTRVLTNSAGVVTDTWQYEAFGTELARTGTTVNEYRYTGEQIDANTGFYFLRARWMDPEVGRFVSLDSWSGRASEPVTLHRYLYANANPVNGTDPSGLMTLGELGTALNIQIRMVSTTTSYRILFKKTGCLLIEALAEEAITHGVYIFLDGFTGLPYVGKTKNAIDTRLKQHAKDGARLVSSVVAKFQVAGGKAELQVIEQLMYDLLKPETDLANRIRPLSETRPSKAVLRSKLANIKLCK